MNSKKEAKKTWEELLSRTDNFVADRLKLDKKDGHILSRNCLRAAVNFAKAHNISTASYEDFRMRSIYVHKARTMVEAIQHDPTLLQKHDLRDLPYLNDTELRPDVWSELIEAKKLREEFETKKPEAMTSEYKCSKCKGRSCKWEERQLRSMDEPSTIIVHCLECGHLWRM